MDHDVILHQYDISPFTRKVKMALAIKGVAWRACTQPVIAPKPDLIALTGGYRRIPVLQIGADIYCDSDLILRVIDRLFPDPPLEAEGPGGLAFALAPGFGLQLTQVAVPLVFGTGRAVDPAFAADREEVMGAAFVDTARWAAEAPHAAETLRAQLGWIDAVLSDGRPWLNGSAPGLADIFAYPVLAFLDEMETPVPAVETLRGVGRWMARAFALGDGKRSEISRTEAVAVAAAAQPAALTGVMPGEPNGLTAGDDVVVRASDYGRDPVRGRLVAASPQSVTLIRVDERAGEVAVHFPRVGFTIARVE